jgi:TrmH family RNA methyltransferase
VNTLIKKSQLFQLKPGQRRRKLALMLGEIERSILGLSDETHKNPELADVAERRQLLWAVAKLVSQDEKILPEERDEILSLPAKNDADERRLCNICRNALLKILKIQSAEWDLIVAPHDSSQKERKVFSGMHIFAEDIRSPFNMGSIFRTAEAFGAEKIFLSPLCCDCNHQRSQRSAMGCIDILPHETCALEALPEDLPIFALETGGTPLNEFDFPEKGIVILGSEELGISPAALKRATAGIVTIPLDGVKASLNVSVAFGVLMNAWAASLKKRGIEPV